MNVTLEPNTGGLAFYHREFWAWVWGVTEHGTGPDGHSCFCAIWFRGGAKSTHSETACIALGTHSRRRYGWYVCSRQAQADDHVTTISQRLTSPEVIKAYPQLSEAKVQHIGDRARQLGWRRNRLWTEHGLVIDALGLDSAVRGAKLGDDRPAFMVFDDLDEELDAEGTIERKIAALTRKIIPAGAPDCVYIVAQNLVHPNGIVTRLVDGRATYLGSRTVSGPHPAIEGLEYEGAGTDAVITAGTPTWSVFGLDVCQQKIRDAGIDAFLAECQHEISLFGAPRFDRDALAIHQEQCRPALPRKGLPEWAQDGFTEVWQLPIGGVSYVAYFDGAEGVGSDYCVTIIMRADTKQMVAMVRDNKREQREHAGVAARLIKEYNNAFVGWERSHEADFAVVMEAEGITRVYTHPEPLTLAQQVNGTEPRRHRGYPARQRERRVLVARVANYIERQEGVIPSIVVVSECKTFVKTERQPDGEASSGNKDDALFGFGGALLMCDQPGAQGSRVKMSSGSYSYVRPR